MLDTMLTVVALALGIAGLWWVVNLDPHWASRDGTRFIARAQRLTQGEQPLGRWREVRADVTLHGTVMMRPRGPMAGPLRGEWRIVGSTLDDRGKRVLYLAVRADGGDTRPQSLVARIPASSRARPVLDALVRGGEGPSVS